MEQAISKAVQAAMDALMALAEVDKNLTAAGRGDSEEAMKVNHLILDLVSAVIDLKQMAKN